MKLLSSMICVMLLLTACDDRTAQQIGEDLAKQKVDIIKGAGEVVKNEGEGVANTVAQGVGNIFTGLSSGFNESLLKTEVRLSDSIQPSTLKVNRAQKLFPTGGDEREGLSVYLSSADGFAGKLRLIAHSKEGEVGRSNTKVKLQKDEAKFIDFEFDKRTPFSIVEYYALELVQK